MIYSWSGLGQLRAVRTKSGSSKSNQGLVRMESGSSHVKSWSRQKEGQVGIELGSKWFPVWVQLESRWGQVQGSFRVRLGSNWFMLGSKVQLKFGQKSVRIPSGCSQVLVGGL